MANGVAEGEAFLGVSGGLSGAEREHGTLASAVHRVRTDHAPANFTTIKHMALNLIRRAPGKDSIRLRRNVAVWDDNLLRTPHRRMNFSPDSPGRTTTAACLVGLRRSLANPVARPAAGISTVRIHLSKSA